MATDELCRDCKTQPAVNKKHRCQACTNAIAARARKARKEKSRTLRELRVPAAPAPAPTDLVPFDPERAVSLAGQAAKLWSAGLRSVQIAVDLDVPPETVIPMVALGWQQGFDGETREVARHLSWIRLERIYETCNDPDVARKCVMDMARLYGLVSTGGNTLNVGVSVSNTKLDDAIDAWLVKNDTLEGEVVEG